MNIRHRLALGVILLASSPAAFAEGANNPVKIPAGQAAGPIFKDPRAKHDGGFTYFELGGSSDRKFATGVFKSGPGNEDFTSYPNDEFCYFISGSSTLISADGSTVIYKAGDSAFIPKGWKGRWVTSGFSKFYATYQGPEAQ